MLARLIALASGMSTAERLAIKNAARGPRVGFWRFMLWYLASGGLAGLAAAQDWREREAASRVEIIPPARSASPLRRGSIIGRFAALCWLLGLALIVFGIFRAYGHDPYAADAALVWFFLAACVLGFLIVL